ncbi:Mariner Mos1 transposase [Eumeta japonica]|uniref:Mariner Mos1 transposase n=1 Tax=Eumeta variegata TaxID=151549 RepID=A0A4C1TZI2_EUMVA|nr:Mariner Mos1 transposase [Eumeta japonica]
MLTPFQKKQRIDATTISLTLCGKNPAAILGRIVTGNEVWDRYYDPESKQESMQWHKKGTPYPKKCKVSQSVGKLIASILWDAEGILLIDYKDKGVNITGEYYATLIDKLRVAIKYKRRGKLTKGVLLLHDNVSEFLLLQLLSDRVPPTSVGYCFITTASTHSTFKKRDFLDSTPFSLIDHPRCSFDLAPCDFFDSKELSITIMKQRPLSATTRLGEPNKLTACIDDSIELLASFCTSMDLQFFFDSDLVPTLVFDPSLVLNFGPGSAFTSVPGSVLDSAFGPAFNSDSNHSSDLNETGG